jgi:hypothetical protein
VAWKRVIRNTRCTTSVSHTGGKLTTGVVDTCDHIFPEICIDRSIDTGGKFAASVNNASG